MTDKIRIQISRKFFNYLFSGSAYNSEDCTFRQIVTNREMMNKNIDNLSKINNEVYDRYKASVDSGAFRPAYSMEKVYGDKYSTDDMKEIVIPMQGHESDLYTVSLRTNCYFVPKLKFVVSFNVKVIIFVS